MDRKCRICGDRVLRLGFHFSGQPSCTSCRVFFHRNAAKFEKLKCKNSDSCDVATKATRKRCAKCRLKRCFAIGMEQKTRPAVPETSESTLTSPPPSTSSNETQSLRSVLTSPFIIETDTIASPPPSDNDENNNPGTSKSPLKPESKQPKSLNLTSFEQSQIDLINQNVSEVFEEEDQLELIEGETESITYISKISCVYAKRIVRFCKKFDFFRALTVDDQLRLLKLFAHRAIGLRVAFNLDPKIHSVRLLATESGSHAIIVKPLLGSYLKGKERIHRHKNKMALLNASMENDKTTRNLYLACLLANPTQEDAHSFPSILRYQYYFYVHLLLRHLEAKYKNTRKAKLKYETMFTLFYTDVQKMKDNIRQMLIEFGVDQVSDFMAEVMNLK